MLICFQTVRPDIEAGRVKRGSPLPITPAARQLASPSGSLSLLSVLPGPPLASLRSSLHNIRCSRRSIYVCKLSNGFPGFSLCRGDDPNFPPRSRQAGTIPKRATPREFRISASASFGLR